MALVPWKYSSPYHNANMLSQRSFAFCGHWLEVSQDPSADIDTRKNTHEKLWDGAYILSSFLESSYFAKDFWLDKQCIELGSGTGLVGMVAWLHGADVVLTDRGDCLERTQGNVRRNVDNTCAKCEALDSTKIDVQPLSWGSDDEVAALLSRHADPSDARQGSFDVVLASEVVYLPDLARPLLKTLRSVCSDTTSVFLCYKPRGLGEDVFWSLLSEYGFRSVTICQTYLPCEFQQSPYSIHHIIKDNNQ